METKQTHQAEVSHHLIKGMSPKFASNSVRISTGRVHLELLVDVTLVDHRVENVQDLVETTIQSYVFGIKLMPATQMYNVISGQTKRLSIQIILACFKLGVSDKRACMFSARLPLKEIFFYFAKITNREYRKNCASSLCTLE